MLYCMQSAFAMSPSEYVQNADIKVFDRRVNQQLSETFDQHFSAQAFKAFIEKDKKNSVFKNEVKNYMQGRVVPLVPSKKLKIIVNMGLGWDFNNVKEQPYYVQNFISDIQKLGSEVIFLDKFPYAPVEQNIESIKPQLKSLLRDPEASYILLSLCKGTPEILIAAAELIQENPLHKKKIAGFINMSGMMGGTFLADERVDLDVLTDLIMMWEDYVPLKRNFKKYDRRNTVWSLPFMSKASITKNIKPVLKVSFDNIPVINVSGAILDDMISKSDSPLKMFVSYNSLMSVYPYGNDGFIDVTETRLPVSMFANQKTIILNSSHLLTDGSFDQYRLDREVNRVAFYRGLYQSLLREIR